MNVLPSPISRAVVAAELVLIAPAALFMSALVARRFPPTDYEPAQTAQRIVAWYAARQWTLWVLLVGLPLAVLLTGGAALLRGSRDRTHARKGTRRRFPAIHSDPATLLVASTTVAAAGVLAVVVVHMLAN